MKKHIAALLLAAVLAVCCVPACAAEAPAVSPFTDVPTDMWCYPYVRDLYQEGVVRGVKDGVFSPDAKVTWGQAIKMILGAIGVKADESKNSGHWADVYIQPAVSNRLVDSFRAADLDKSPTRAQVARMVARALDLTSISGESPYVDCDNGYVTELDEKGIMEGVVKNGQRYFFPDNTMTRAEITTTIWRMMNVEYTQGMLRVGSWWVDLLDEVEASPFTRDQFSLDEKGRMQYSGGYYSLGIDVSRHKETIDWEAVKADGIDFAIIRCGGRLLQSGTIFEDGNYRKNIEGALAAGLDVGVYFFSQALNTREGLEEAEFVLDLIDGYDVTYPVVCDWEGLDGSAGRTWNNEQEDTTAGIAAFCERVKEAGYTPMLYFNKAWGMTRMDLRELDQYDFWFAEYTKYPSCPYNFQMWQYSSTGKVDGINSTTDMDICFVPYN